MQSLFDGFVCEKDVVYCYILFIIDNVFIMIDLINGLFFVDEGIFCLILQFDKEVLIENVIIVDGWNIILLLLMVNKFMLGFLIFFY